MLNKVEYWLDLADEDLETTKWLYSGKRLLHTAYFCHQVCEKTLKAAVADTTDDIPPKTHDLVKLAKLCSFFSEFTVEQQTFLDEIAQYQIEARYPEHKQKMDEKLTDEYCNKILKKSEEFLCWIKNRLGK
jgi:HEPN domain-containing protein